MSGFTFGGATTPAGGSLFGATPAASAAGSLFGAKPTTPGSNNLFGAAAQPATPASGTGLFGSTPALSTPASGGLFGATATPATGLFGAATTSATPAAGGLFGATTTSTAPAAGGLFGAPAASAAPATGGFFGGTPASGIGSNLFGAASSTAPASGGFFGAKPAASGFSFAVPGTSTAPAAGSLFGAAPKPFGSSGFGQRQQYVIGNVKPEIPVWYNLMYIKNSWDPTHPNCQFKYFFYNFVHPDDVNKYGPPPNVDPFEWQQAVRECPDKECMVPALAIGFEDLKKRMETQNDMTEMQRIKLEEIEVKMNEIMQFHVVQTATKVREFKRRHIQLAQRVLTLMKRVQILRNRGVPIREDEELLRVRLENALEQLRNPAHFRGKITELWAQLQILKDSKRLHPYSSHGVPDASQLEAVGKVLQEQQAGLAHITSIIQQDMEDIEILQRKLEETKRA
ncbi:nucleoporin complex subunit 54-domain-containing protein [Lobosporangium transversale]|uniref:Nucleoporin complex subunit 54-domain-containing protein n=1 Tax=Lobosporangium transversale TaxID=64571 RepID=A0A1Y2H0Q1_9FUNG|nr:nucleoporin complex subunit 54-domain-containing protein [Lobosporangium transversale]ORZ27303.1 nucleoporin complex subunit 54-domain-containing protein [Lobosporangium transversale]|eukprot:XP_021885030.1 nucleoporin complex subunit 54-domain-containing protein [Lobosporangium transversale]